MTIPKSAFDLFSLYNDQDKVLKSLNVLIFLASQIKKEKLEPEYMEIIQKNVQKNEEEIIQDEIQLEKPPLKERRSSKRFKLNTQPPVTQINSLVSTPINKKRNNRSAQKFSFVSRSISHYHDKIPIIKKKYNQNYLRPTLVSEMKVKRQENAISTIKWRQSSEFDKILKTTPNSNFNSIIQVIHQYRQQQVLQEQQSQEIQQTGNTLIRILNDQILFLIKLLFKIQFYSQKMLLRKLPLRQVRMMTMRDALNSAIDEELARDPTVFIMGEEIAVYEGAYKITKNLLKKYGPTRVVDTPITEMGFAGIAVGAAMNGLKPIVEFMSFNFAMQAIDHIINSAGKTLYMSGGEVKCPIVFRGANGPASALGATHMHCYASWYAQCPGLKVLAPYSAEDSRGLLKAAIRDPDVCVFLESEVIYGVEHQISDEALDKDFVLPIGKAKIEREGTDITIVSFSKALWKVMQTVDTLQNKYGISAEVINLRTLKPLDRNTIIESVMKTGRLLTVEEGFPQHGVGAEIAAIVTESDAFDFLDAPIERITSAEVPAPYAFDLELAFQPQPQNIINASLRLMKGVEKQ